MNNPPPKAADTDPLPREVRQLMRGRAAATLATSLQGAQGWPYASLVLVAAGLDATPLLLISKLAEHTKNIAADPRVSILFDGTEGAQSRLAAARATVLGRAVPAAGNAEALARYIARHPEAQAYAGFADFGLFEVQVERAHLVAGFGRIHWVDGKDILLPRAALAGFAEAEAEAIAVAGREPEMLRQLTANLPPAEWHMTGCDPDGCDLRAGSEVARLTFAQTVTRAADLAHALRQLSQGRTMGPGA